MTYFFQSTFCYRPRINLWSCGPLELVVRLYQRFEKAFDPVDFDVNESLRMEAIQVHLSEPILPLSFN